MSSRDLTGSPVNAGSDASVDNFSAKSMCGWVYWGGSTGQAVFGKSNGAGLNPTGWSLRTVVGVGNTGSLQFIEDYVTLDGTWTTPNNSFSANTLVHVAVTQSSGATPTIYINGVSQALTTTAPIGARNSDAAQDLQFGAAGVLSFGGSGSGFLYTDVVLTQGEVRRHMHWGYAPGGARSAAVIHPLWDSSVTNKGTATANDSASHTAGVNDIPRMERMWGRMMGVGR